MGIQGLLPLLKSIMVPIHIKDLEGCSVAIDTYSWLHKGALSCSTELCKGLPTSRHIEYCMHRVNLLRHYGVKPVLVFDGGLLPMKIEQENKRARSRKENLSRAIEHESYGNLTAAYECYQKAVDISPSIAHELILSLKVLKQESVSYVVAPYEADAQMTFLAISKQVDAVITEDSDLIPFGCPRVIFKMDKFGQGVEFKSSMLQQNKELNFSGFTGQMLLEMCILSGCDYLQSLPGMGLRRAHALIKKFKSHDKVIKHLRYSSISVPPLYEESFRKAILTFQHQRVYDPTIEDIVHLYGISDNVGDDLDFLGPPILQHIAQGIARGELDPFTQMPFQGASDSYQLVLDKNLLLKSFKPESEKRKLDLPVQKNLLTNYFCFASVEAKRNFKAPRVSPKHSCPVANSPIIPEEYIIVDDASCKTDALLLSLPDSENTKNSVENGYNSELPEYSENISHAIVNEMRSPQHALPQESLQSTCSPPALNKGHDSSSIPDAAKIKATTESRKVTVKSRYFQKKQVDENDPEDKQRKFCSKSDFANVLPESYIIKGMTLKRKNASLECADAENVNTRQIYMVEARDGYPGVVKVLSKYGALWTRFVHIIKGDDSGNCNPNVETLVETKAEDAKFGSNISHLGHYYDIAGKSMERFVSVISSFRFSSPGSRASGLRAPLKDALNTSTIRSSAAVDLSQFAYVPTNNKKATLTSRRF